MNTLTPGMKNIPDIKINIILTILDNHGIEIDPHWFNIALIIHPIIIATVNIPSIIESTNNSV